MLYAPNRFSVSILRADFTITGLGVFGYNVIAFSVAGPGTPSSK